MKTSRLLYREIIIFHWTKVSGTSIVTIKNSDGYILFCWLFWIWWQICESCWQPFDFCALCCSHLAFLRFWGMLVLRLKRNCRLIWRYTVVVVISICGSPLFDKSGPAAHLTLFPKAKELCGIQCPGRIVMRNATVLTITVNYRWLKSNLPK